MPDGRIHWIDEASATVHIARRARHYLASMSDVDGKARFAGARVHFDARREDGVDRAVNVQLVPGARRNRRHRRQGDLTGARHPGSKFAGSSPAHLGVDVTTQPVRLTHTWLRALSEDDVDGALSLYAPDAVLHGAHGASRGRASLRAAIADDRPHHLDLEKTVVSGSDDLVRVDWPTDAWVQPAGEAAAAPTYLRVQHGQIVEQWDRLESEPEPAAAATDRAPFDLVVRGEMSPADRDYARDHFGHMLERVTDPIPFARLKINVTPSHPDRPVSASATVDVDGSLIRAHVDAPTVSEVVDVICSRVRRQHQRLLDRRQDTHVGRASATGSWHHGDDATFRPTYYDRPIETRELVRHKTFAAEEQTVEEAAHDMAMLDYSFFLFPDLASGQDSVLAHTDEGLALQRLDGSTIEALNLEHPETAIETSAPGPSPVPALTVRGAMERLDATEQPFVFFCNTASERGNVVYRRLDGHYGLITPAD